MYGPRAADHAYVWVCMNVRGRPLFVKGLLTPALKSSWSNAQLYHRRTMVHRMNYSRIIRNCVQSSFYKLLQSLRLQSLYLFGVCISVSIWLDEMNGKKISFIHNNCEEKKINTLWIIADCQPWKIRMKLRTAKPQYSGLKWHFFCVKIDSNKLLSTLKWNKISGSCCFIKIKTNKFQTTHHNRRRLSCHWYRLPYCNCFCFCFNVILLVAGFLWFSFTKINSKEIHKTN